MVLLFLALTVKVNQYNLSSSLKVDYRISALRYEVKQFAPEGSIYFLNKSTDKGGKY